MSRLRIVAVVLTTVSMVTAGCFYVPQGDAVSISVYGQGEGTDSGVALNPISISGSEFRMKGYLSVGGGAADRSRYRTISVRLYSKSGDLLCVEHVGDWNVTRTKNVSISRQQIPHYVVVYSPDFWNGPMTVEYFEYDENETVFRPREADSPDELPVKVSDKQADPC